MEIIAYRKYNDIDVLFEDFNCIVKNVRYDHFKEGAIKCPYERTILEIGFFGEGNYKSRDSSGKKTKEYNTWRGMLERCYDKKRLNIFPTYRDCKVCDEWLNFQNFAEWYEENYYEIEGEKMHLDKDILVKGNKLYSPETCVFVPHEINTLFVKSNSIRGKNPIGVSYHNRDDIFEVNLKKHNKQIYLGRFKNEIDAFNCYKQAKEKYIKQIADQYKDLIPKKLYDAMYKYEVEITD